MRVVVTGATGNVGTSVLASLRRDERIEEIVAVARRVPALTLGKVRWRTADVSNSDLRPLFAGADAVVHLAWLIQPSHDWLLTHRVNVEGSARVMEAVARAGVPSLIYASAAGAYAPGPPDARVDESWPVTGVPTSTYSREKAEVERALDEFQERHEDVRVARLRPVLSFKALAAAGIRRLFMGRLVPARLLRRRTIPLLPFPRDLRTQAVHSDDLGEAYRLATVGDVHGSFNIAADPVLDVAALARILRARPLELPPRIVRSAAAASWRLRLQPTPPGWLDIGMLGPIVDSSRARVELGWSPRVPATAAVAELLEGLRRGEDMGTPPLQRTPGGPVPAREARTHVSAAH